MGLCIWLREFWIAGEHAFRHERDHVAFESLKYIGFHWLAVNMKALQPPWFISAGQREALMVARPVRHLRAS